MARQHIGQEVKHVTLQMTSFWKMLDNPGEYFICGSS